MTTYIAQSGPSASGYYEENILNMCRYLMDHGYSRAGAAGIAGCVAGESLGDPEAMQGGGSGGGGLIQWTPISAYPGLVTGNPTQDLNAQLPAIIRFNNASGSSVSALNACTDPVAAADYYSQHFERPAVTDSDVRASVASRMYSLLGTPPPPPDPYPNLAQGASGPAVVTLQNRLNAWHASPQLVRDGSFGPATERAVRIFQADFHPPVDGNIGADDWAVLKGTPVAIGTYPAPTGLAAVTGAGTAALSWHAVVPSAGKHVTGYQVVVYNDPPVLDAGKHWTPVRNDTVTGLKANITGLGRGKAYQAHVWALGSPVSSQANYAVVKFRAG